MRSADRARLRRRSLALVPAAAACVLLGLQASGCSDGPVFCTAELVPGIAIKIVDAETGAAAACGASAWLVSGSWSELLDDAWNCSAPDSLQSPWIEGAFERAGSYTVLVLKDGYVPWSRTGVRVSGYDCHVQTVNLEARLVRSE